MFIRVGTGIDMFESTIRFKLVPGLFWSVKEESSTTHLKHEEVEPMDGGNGPVMTQPIGRRTDHGELLSSLKMNSRGLTVW